MWYTNSSDEIMQIVHIQIRMLLKEYSDQGIYCLPVHQVYCETQKLGKKYGIKCSIFFYLFCTVNSRKIVVLKSNFQDDEFYNTHTPTDEEIASSYFYH